ncbi:MAG: hypothetical protein LPJ98_03220, partial [Cyclobacteriaceae bacterium]|nr:hypothetical protein [Cyclobacteriaceae bacterium]
MIGKRIIKQVVPNRYLKFIKSRLNKYKCPVCENPVKSFLPISYKYYENLEKYEMIYHYDQLETLNHKNYRCPTCKSNDRDRLYTLYIKRIIQLSSKTKHKLVDFGPSLGFSNWLKNHDLIEYRSADLFKENVDDKVDIMDM